MSHSTPLSTLADRLRIRRNNLPTEKLVNETCNAASRELDKISNKLSGATRFSIAMAQELQEIIGENEEEGAVNPLPAAQGLLDEWEVFFQVMNLIDEVAE
ncbi:MAG: hypothetical protein JKY50_07330 [Oleispira sp.]|nr:hypothetical protein [Oleispira sp.]MBL4881187.1 hypothetical protein [Oleispira sp.]